jgi:hypothetical protein
MEVVPHALRILIATVWSRVSRAAALLASLISVEAPRTAGLRVAAAHGKASGLGDSSTTALNAVRDIDGTDGVLIPQALTASSARRGGVQSRASLCALVQRVRPHAILGTALSGVGELQGTHQAAAERQPAEVAFVQLLALGGVGNDRATLVAGADVCAPVAHGVGIAAGLKCNLVARAHAGLSRSAPHAFVVRVA